MRFYDALQLDPAILKRKIAACGTKQEKLYYWAAMAVRSALIVAFAISVLSGVFGSDNTPLAVASFCIMLGIRFVNFEYCIGDSLLTLAAALCILVLAPSASAVIPPIFLIPLHVVSFFSLLYMTTQRPEMGNGGLYSFAYVYLVGNPVTGEALIRRGLLALTGYPDLRRHSAGQTPASASGGSVSSGSAEISFVQTRLPVAAAHGSGSGIDPDSWADF